MEKMKTSNLFSSLTPRDGEEGGDGVEVREADAHSPKRWGNRAHHHLHQQAVGYDGAATSTAVYRSRRGEVGRWIDRNTSRNTRKQRQATSS